MADPALLLSGLTFVVGIGLGSYLIRAKIQQLRRNVRTLDVETGPRRDAAWERLERDGLEHALFNELEDRDPARDRELWR